MGGRSHIRYLDQAKTLRDFLETHPEGANYRVPERVVRIEHCLCTPHVEYVPDTSGELWFDDETPRICIPQELIEFAKGEKPRLLTEEELAEFA